MNFNLMKKIFHPDYEYLESHFDSLLTQFKTSGELIGSEKRNIIKVFKHNNFSINIKSFKIPNVINAVVYGYIRKSKARRSFEYARILQSNGIGTPQPFAFFENKTLLGLKESYYFSEHQDVDCEFRKIIFDPGYPNREEIIKQLARFFYIVHNFGIEFIDNTAGNTLVKKKDNENYAFYLVDLNRMRFHKNFSIVQRASNLAKLTNDVFVNNIISEEYSKLLHIPKDTFYNLLQSESNRFLNNFNRRKNLKKKLFFWK